MPSKFKYFFFFCYTIQFFYIFISNKFKNGIVDFISLYKETPKKEQVEKLDKLYNLKDDINRIEEEK